jgi:hypothetical protein
MRLGKENRVARPDRFASSLIVANWEFIVGPDLSEAVS